MVNRVDLNEDDMDQAGTQQRGMWQTKGGQVEVTEADVDGQGYSVLAMRPRKVFS